jgi:hypothetical protein
MLYFLLAHATPAAPARVRVRARTPSFGRDFGERAVRRRSSRTPSRSALNALVPYSLLIIQEMLRHVARTPPLPLRVGP